MNPAILSPKISQADSLISSTSLELLRPYLLTDNNRSLVFFVGAGASIAGNTGMPSTPTLLYALLKQALSQSGKFTSGEDDLTASLKEISYGIGFEITLNDFWQICREATTFLYQSFADLEINCTPNRVHTFLADWLSRGGTVVTTNYDRLIEREWAKTGSAIHSMYRAEGPNSFEGWEKTLIQGGALHKIHGSLDDPDSCLGALEHVGTQLTGKRADLLEEILLTRPLCFVGWRGVDPDIPPLLYRLLERRSPSLPTFWIHYEGHPSGSISLQNAIDECSNLIKPYASHHPILTDADRICGEFLNWIGIPSMPNPGRQVESFDFTEAIGDCTKSGLVRMVGITLRRAGKYSEAETTLKMGLQLAETPGEHNAALQEISLLQQQITGRETGQARKSLEQAREALKEQPDLHLQLNNDFGSLSMTIITLKSHPWLLLRLPGLFRKYRQDIDILQRNTIDKESVALHKSLLQLSAGRLRFKLFAWLGIIIHPFADWILRPFEIAHSTIDDAKDIHLHSHIDVLAYRAVALAYFGRCLKMQEDIPEISRLIAILNDEARTRHWAKQAEEIQRNCGKN